MLKREIVDGTLEITDTETGEFRKIKLATMKQIEFIRKLEKELDYEPKRYIGLNIWQAKKIIDKMLKQKQQGRFL